MGYEHEAAALRVVRSLTGGRWTWPPVEVRELYPAPTRKLLLRGVPVREVVSVKDYADGTDIEYVQFGRWLELKPRYCRSDLRVDVTYRYGSPPSTLAGKAISVLAAEMMLADSNDAACRLPERVTSISRQGTSWTLIDPMDFIDKGRTGVYEVDLLLTTMGTARARSRVYSGAYPPPDRISTTVLDVTNVT